MAIKVEKTKKNLIKCLCKFCPSYPLGCLIKAGPQMAKIFLTSEKKLEKETRMESLFCAFEASKCIKKKRGCKCPNCSVHKKYVLDQTFYCRYILA